MIHKRDSSFDTILHTTASMAVTISVAVTIAVAAVATIAVAVAMEALVTGTVKAAEEVQQQPKREQRDQAASNSTTVTAFVRLVPAPICSLASAPRLLLWYSQV